MLPRVITSLLLVLAFHTAVAQVNLNNGLTAWLPFTLNTNDASGNGNNGIPQNGIQLTTDRFGDPNSAYYFDGIDDYIVIRDLTQKFSTTPFSSVIWFQSLTQNAQVMIGKRNYGSNNGQQFQVALFRPGKNLSASVISNAIPCSDDLTPDAISLSTYSEPFCQDKWHCVIVTFDGAFQRMFLDGKLVSQHVPNFNTMLQCASDIRLGSWWSGDPLWFNGKLDDFRWYNRVLNEDEIKALASETGESLTLDFVFEKKACSSKTVQFNPMSSYPRSVKWQFGDGTDTIAAGSVIHTYPSNKIYTVKLFEEDTNSCTDSLGKFIDLGISEKDIIFTASDTTVCVGDSVRFRTKGFSDFCWNADATLFGTNEANTHAKPAVNTTYYLVGEVLKDNLVKNGDFNKSNQDFFTELQFSTVNSVEGQYGIVKDPKLWDSRVMCPNCRDHTRDSAGLMMVVGGPKSVENAVWCQTVAVTPGKMYKIGFWGSIYGGGQLTRPGIFINGMKAGELAYALQDYFEWTLFSVYWNSGTATSAELCIKLVTPFTSRNVFAIDDILFAESEMSMDSVKISVRHGGTLEVSKDTNICKGKTAQIFVSGGSNYTWSPSAGLSDPHISNPIASPLQTTRYYVNSLPASGNCAARDSVLISMAPTPDLVISPETSICSGGTAELSVTGAEVYNWSPQDGLSNPGSATTKANPSATTIYSVEGAYLNGCKDTATVKLIVSPPSKLYVPTAFSPNNDGVNDCFRIPNAAGSTNFELAVFNRFGERVFYTIDPLKCWDGTFKTERLSVGAFTYFVKMKNGCGDLFKKGTVSIIR